MQQIEIVKPETEKLPQLFGLVLCGGQSSRMNFDKSLIEYHGLPQRYFLYKILKELCSEVFISCNSNQENSIPPDYRKIVDQEKFGNIGPMNALLSAFEIYPEKSWLIVGCDYPFLTKKNLINLIHLRNSQFEAVAYFNKVLAFAEPLITIYEKEIHEHLLKSFNQNEFSLKHFLSKLNSNLIVPDSLDIITSVDSKELSDDAIQKILFSKS